MTDPFFDREAEKYENPIPSREYILDLISKRPRSKHQLFDLFDIEDHLKKALANRLRAMVRDKQLSCNKKGIYKIFSDLGLYTGTVIANPKGFGFIALDKGGKDLRLSSKQMQLVFHGDRVNARLLNKQGDAEIVKVLETVKSVVGRLEIEDGEATVIVDDKRIKHRISIPNISQEHSQDQIVLVSLIKSPTFESLAIGEIIDTLGQYMDEGVETDSAIVRHSIPVEFSNKTEQELKNIPDEVNSQQKKDREDLTKTPLITIDGEDSRDFDDAVFAEPASSGWRLIVSIADVASYVKEESSLDRDALERGNSVYFPHRVIPMLPEKLSNGLCSLNPNVDRLCLSCEIFIDYEGNLMNYRFFPAVMHSHARLTYTEVGKILDGDHELEKKYQHVIENIRSLHGLYKTLRISRTKRGVMDFDRVESQMIFNDNGKIDNILPRERNDAHKLIEECMLMANRAAAKFLSANKEHFLYRVHPDPTLEKINTTRKFLSARGLVFEGGDNPESKDFAKVLIKAKGRDDENVIKTVVLRTMKQATYTPQNSGHFGLALDDYTHFTSPIRRYPDLIVHRAIYRVLNGDKPSVDQDIISLGDHCSMTERRADDATRDVEQWLKCEYMRDKIGENFTGIISGVTGFGFFVELNDVFVEGLVTVRDLNDDYYVYDEASYSLIGDRSGKKFSLGDKIEINVASVDLDQRQMLFVPTSLINQ
jgi:ribonuclease R